jgi:hypothetical protein
LSPSKRAHTQPLTQKNKKAPTPTVQKNNIGATTLAAALAAGRRAIGYEIDPAALAIARSKLAEAFKTAIEQ